VKRLELTADDANLSGKRKSKMKEAYIRFMAPVVPQTATTLLKIIDAKIREKCTRLHLMLSSPGGSVFHGLSIYNFLKGAPLEVYTYNFGSVDSIGVVIFCSGGRRFCVPHARFLIHGVSFNIHGNHSFDEQELEEKLKALKIDYQNIARVIADTAQKPAHKVEDDMNRRTTLNPTEAKDYGLVHEIKSELFPIDADLSVVSEDLAYAQQVTLPNPPQHPPKPLPHATVPVLQSFTRPSNSDNGTFFL
jgi:ATP-dependent protease ClpP protease subunit